MCCIPVFLWSTWVRPWNQRSGWHPDVFAVAIVQVGSICAKLPHMRKPTPVRDSRTVSQVLGSHTPYPSLRLSSSHSSPKRSCSLYLSLSFSLAIRLSLAFSVRLLAAMSSLAQVQE